MVDRLSRLRHGTKLTSALVLMVGAISAVQAQGGASATAPSSDGDRSSGGVTNGMGDAKSNNTAASAGVTANPASTPRPVFGLQDRRRLRALAQAHLAETKLAGLATANATDPPTRGYAEKMLEVHGRALDDVRLLARRSSVVLPGGLESEQANLLHVLSLKTGAQFDQLYLQTAGVEVHEQSARLLEETVNGPYAAELKTLARNQLQAVRQQLQLAQQMQAAPANVASLVAASVLAGQSGSAATGADTALSQPGNRQGNNGAEKGSASLAGAAVHPRH